MHWLDVLRAKLSKHPVMLSHLLTQRCNLSCPYCLWKDNAAKEMTTRQIQSLHKQAAECGFVGVFLWGGEPLLRRDFQDIVLHAKQQGLTVSMATNGTLLPSYAVFVDTYVDKVLVSIDLPSEAHDTLRKGKAFNQAIKGIKMLRKCKKAICSVISQHNKEYMKELAQLAQNLACTWIPQHMDVPRGGEQVDDVSQKERDAIIDELLTLKNNGFPIGVSKTYLRQFRSPLRSFHCRCQHVYLTVWPNGDVRSCVSGDHIANLASQPLAELLQSPAYKDFLKQSKQCSRCKDAGTLESTYAYVLRPEPLLNLARHF